MIERIDRESPTDAGSRALGLVVVAVLTLIVALVVILMAFSTTNTPISVDGDKATYSRDLDSGE